MTDVLLDPLAVAPLPPLPATLVPAATAARSGSEVCAWLVHHRRTLVPPGRRYRVAKRAIDLAAVLVLLPLALPVFALCALAVRLDGTSGPVFFVQERTGFGGARFRIRKFRTMVPDAEALKAQLAHLNERSGPDFKISQDPRITKVGRLLRKLSLDELPQLLNVLDGSMTLVGPRPTSFAKETFDGWQLARFDVTPGLTGLWQVGGRDTESFDERLRLDISYVERRSLGLDLVILVRSIPAVLLGRGAS